MKKLGCLLLFASLPAWADDFSGVWKVDGSIADHPVAPTCTLKQAEDKISGTCKVDTDHVVDTTGSVKDKQVSWTYQQEYEGTMYTVVFTGALDGNTAMKGTLTADPADAVGEFTAKKQ